MVVLTVSVYWCAITAFVGVTSRDVPDSNFRNPAKNRMWPNIRRRVRPEPEPDSVMAAPLLRMLMMCTCNLCKNCSVLMSVTWFVLLLHNVMLNICLFRRQLGLTSNLKLTGFYDIHARLKCF